MNVAAAPSFNPLTGWTTGPVHGVWASDPLWTPPADGGAVSSWRNGGSVGGDLVQATGSKQPTYDASLGAYNNQPVVTLDATDDHLTADITDISQPFYLLVIGNLTSALVSSSAFMESGAAGARFGANNSPAWVLVAGVGLVAGTPDTNPHVLMATVNGASSNITVDGASVVTGNAGASALANFCIGSSTTAGNTSVAYAAVFNTNPTALPEWAAFKAWCLSFYGITVA